MKRACRARDQREPIHPNARLPLGVPQQAEAVFELSINGKPKEANWVNNKPAPDELSSLAIFDARCARAYLDNEDDFSYVPYGLDILKELARVCKQLEERIKAEQSQNDVDLAVFEEIWGTTTQVGALISGLSAKTKLSKVEELSNVSDQEVVRRDDLSKTLAADNPKEKATQLRLRSTRIGKIAKTASEKLAMVDGAAENNLRELVKADRKAKAAVELASQIFKEDTTLLPGTGGEAWKELFEAARKFCTEAHPNKEFPNLGANAQCPFCQQPLKEGADRLVLFEKFVSDEAEQTAKACKKAFGDEYRNFMGQSLALGLDDELFAEIEAIDKALADATRDFGNALTARQGAIKAACLSNEWDKMGAALVSPALQLQTLADKLILEATNLAKVSDENARAAMQAEFNELDARMKLAKAKPAVFAAIRKLELQVKLKSCLGAVKTTGISNKSNELSEKVVSKELADALNTEFKALGAGNLQVSLQSHSAKGKALHKLKLELPQAKSLSDILSEGEQRAIAIGSFLAEVKLGGEKGGIVFDDPVSSLDHKRRERVAGRLIQEAAIRQVIIFTHDIYFVCVLMEEAKRAGVDCATQSLSKKPEGFGVANPDLPFEGLGTKARVGVLRTKQQEIDKFYRDGNEVEHRKQTVEVYRQLRFVWERAVEEVLFQKVVLRFRKGISTQLLAGVAVEDNDYACIENGMTKCSNYSHDQAVLGGTAIPNPDELLVDINALDDWRKHVENRSNEIRKIRTSSSKF